MTILSQAKQSPLHTAPAPPAAESAFLVLFFKTLSARHIRYAVMRNHQPLPDSAGGSDLDILIHPADAPGAKAATQDAIRQAGGVAIGIAKTGHFFQFHALGQVSQAPTPEWGSKPFPVEIDSSTNMTASATTARP